MRKQFHTLLNTMDATNNYTCRRVTIYETSCTLFPKHFVFTCHYICKTAFGTNNVTRNKNTMHNSQSPYSTLILLCISISSRLIYSHLKVLSKISFIYVIPTNALMKNIYVTFTVSNLSLHVSVIH